MIEPIHISTDFGFRVAARYGLDFYIDDCWLTEQGEYGTESREVTHAELAMWCQLVPAEHRELVNGMLMREAPEIETTVEEVYCALLYRRVVYMEPHDFVPVRRLKTFVPTEARKRLLEGHFGVVIDGGHETQVYVSREIPRGYYLAVDEPIEELVWRPAPGKREVRPELPYEMRVALSCDLQMYRVNTWDLPSGGVEVA